MIDDLSPDLILTDGRFYTLDGQNAVAQAVAIKDGRFVAVGGNAEIRDMAGLITAEISLGGSAVIPGLFDSHIHMMETGAKLAAIRLDECTSSEELAALVAQRARQTPPGTWIIGQGWNEGNFPDGRLPTRHDIDPATTEHPVALMRFFNTDVVNSYALRLAGIDRQTPDPYQGKIERDLDGEPNGLLRAKAKGLVERLIPKPTAAEMAEALRLGCQEMLRFGITSVIEPGLNADEIRAYQSFYKSGRLAVRLNLMPSWHGFDQEETETQLEYRARELGVYTGWGDEWLRIGALKMAIDGGTTPHTAYMYEPFEGETEVVNYNRLGLEDLRRYFRTAQELGWDVGIHCCGDHAQDLAVDAFAEICRELPRADARHSIIHGYFPTPRALEQMAKHNIAAVIQPTFIYWEGELLFRDVGQRRALNYKPARKYLDHGVPLAASSDDPSTVSANPFIALYALVTRKNRFGQPIALQEAISRREALQSYTIAGARLTREDHLKGTIAAGKLADLAVLDRDYFRVPDDELKDVKVDMTVVGGKVVWERGA
ncbi:MAG: amidohydrolase [Chloroflexi bacterium]|nr:amidohydrolase [Chloroflexota bacterium]